MLENIDIIIFPDVNPDGKKYSQTADDTSVPISMEDIWWRKNRNPKPVPNGNSPNHATGVDINRNFDLCIGLRRRSQGTHYNNKGSKKRSCSREPSAFCKSLRL